MAEQSITLPVNPKPTESNASNSRRHSIGNAGSSRSGENILPHYLRASTGSCHDLCKYGKKHEFEQKVRRPFLRRNANKPSDEQNSVEFQPERNKTSKDKQKVGLNTPPNIPEIIKREISRNLLNRQTPAFSEVMSEKKAFPGVLLTRSADMQSPVLREGLAKKKTGAKDVLMKSLDSQSTVSSENCAEKRKISTHQRKKTSVVELRNSSEYKTRLSPKIMKQEMSSCSEKPEISLKHASSKVKEEKMSAKPTSFPKLKVSYPDSSRVLNVRENSENKIGQRRTVTSKIAVKREQRLPRVLLSPKTSSGGNTRGLASTRASLVRQPSLRLQMSPRVLLSPKTSSVGIAKGLASSRTSLSLKPSLSRVASLKARKHMGSEIASRLKNKDKIGKTNNEHPKIKNADSDQSTKEPNNNVVQEKTLYVIKTETEAKYFESEHKENHSGESSPSPFLSSRSPFLPESPLSSSHNGEDEEESEYSVTEAEDDPLSEYDETEYVEEADTLRGEHEGLHKKVGMVPSQDQDDKPVKLRFRRGKVIDVQANHNGPRRLNFKRGKMLEESRNLKADAQRSFKRKGAEDHANIEKPDSEKVLLRHQDVHGKKDALCLFNNVIEETASKLVETRKSKVKALVGAFETVISLQDRKPSSNTVS